MNELQRRLDEHGLSHNNRRQLGRFIKGIYPPNDIFMDPARQQVLRLRQLSDVFRWYGVGLVISVLVFVGELAAYRLAFY